MEEEPDGDEAGGSHGDIVRIMENEFARSTVDFNCAYAQCGYGVPNAFYGVSDDGAKGLKSKRFGERWHAAPLSIIKGEWIVL